MPFPRLRDARIQKLLCLAIVFVSVGGCITRAPVPVDLTQAGTATGFVNMTTRVGDIAQPCVVYVPREYDASRSWPLVVFLHGMGERGTDGLKQTEVGIGRAIRRNPDRFPCLVVMPQCPIDSVWDRPRFPGTQIYGDASGHIDDAIRQVREEFNIDENRIALTGLSMGGFGTFLYGAKRTDLFSAFMPICGGGNEEDAAALARRPMRVFHGGDDPVVPKTRSTKMVAAIKAAGGTVQYTEYPKTGHNSWDRAYGEKKAINWLISQTKQ